MRTARKLAASLAPWHRRNFEIPAVGSRQHARDQPEVLDAARERADSGHHSIEPRHARRRRNVAGLRYAVAVGLQPNTPL